MFFFLVRLREYKLGRDNQQHSRLRSVTKPSNHYPTDTLSSLLPFLHSILIFLIMSYRHCLIPHNLPRIFRLIPVIFILLISFYLHLHRMYCISGGYGASSHSLPPRTAPRPGSHSPPSRTRTHQTTHSLSVLTPPYLLKISCASR